MPENNPAADAALKGVTGLRKWQREVMTAIHEHLKDPAPRATASASPR
ncbi:hypothetical protein [Sphingomonas alpina]|uniref:Uncharacterized protein n=1 Tax=Sphingomonas alpina TaxID=653931 RepID=A0A7H0LJU7_9SPHN|nr:hypothetical protein [Sphingomonas alpina]QNQ09950.1 hypothetical protein H3Z74_01455 [Sphingomonas alpina]